MAVAPNQHFNLVIRKIERHLKRKWFPHLATRCCLIHHQNVPSHLMSSFISSGHPFHTLRNAPLFPWILTTVGVVLNSTDFTACQVQIWVLLYHFLSCATLAKSLSLSELLFPHLQNGFNHSPYLIKVKTFKIVWPIVMLNKLRLSLLFIIIKSVWILQMKKVRPSWVTCQGHTTLLFPVLFKQLP